VTQHCADLEDDAQLEALCANLGSLPRISLLVHSAGAYARAAVAADGPELARLFRLNVQVPLLLTARLLPALRAGSADVVFVNSSVAARPVDAELAAYGSSRHAQRAVADALRSEENANGIRVTTIFLGRTAGPLQERIHREERRRYEPERLVQPHDVAELALAIVGLPATAEVTDVHLRPRQPHSDPS
jgi:NADP-dependent 3-hydroxy acid dehydrogenase YdfG